MKNELFFLQRLAQFALERQLLGDPPGHLLGVEQVALAAGFCLLERRLGIAEQGAGVGTVIREHCDADLRGSRDLAVPDAERRAEAPLQRELGKPRELLLALRLGRHNREIIAADARQPRFVATGLPESIGDLLQELVARLPPKRIVDFPESRDVQRQHGYFAIRAACRYQCLCYTPEEQHSLAEASNLCEIGEVI